MATGITHCAKETAKLDLKKEVWNHSKGCWTWKKGSEQRVLPALLAEAAGAGHGSKLVTLRVLNGWCEGCNWGWIRGKSLILDG